MLSLPELHYIHNILMGMSEDVIFRKDVMESIRILEREIRLKEINPVTGEKYEK